jgi:hypothetical protein
MFKIKGNYSAEAGNLAKFCFGQPSPCKGNEKGFKKQKKIKTKFCDNEKIPVC